MTGLGLTDEDRADLHARLVSWFGDDRQAFLVSHLAPVVDRIKAEAYAAGLAASDVRVAEFQWNALEMARKADQAESRAEGAEAEVERLREVISEVRAVFDLQCPPMPSERYMDQGAWVAHSWWNKVLGNILRRVELMDELNTSGTCSHDWLDRPESDTRECLLCGTEVAG